MFDVVLIVLFYGLEVSRCHYKTSVYVFQIVLEFFQLKDPTQRAGVRMYEKWKKSAKKMLASPSRQVNYSTQEVINIEKSKTSLSELKKQHAATVIDPKIEKENQIRRKLKAQSYSIGGVNWSKLFSHYDRDNGGSLQFNEFLYLKMWQLPIDRLGRQVCYS